MSTVTKNKTSYKIFTKFEKKVSLMERFQNYIVENSEVFVSGLMMVNGNAYSVYKMLNG